VPENPQRVLNIWALAWPISSRLFFLKNQSPAAEAVGTVENSALLPSFPSAVGRVENNSTVFHAFHRAAVSIAYDPKRAVYVKAENAESDTA
jgi:hypothetical protein